MGEIRTHHLNAAFGEGADIITWSGKRIKEVSLKLISNTIRDRGGYQEWTNVVWCSVASPSTAIVHGGL